MTNTFAIRLTELRKHRGASQKEVAQALGISQALLSHYEKGIRECGLDFLLKAASYYDVSCDYLLGRVDTRRQFHADFEDGDIEFDSEFRTSTIFRASTMLHDLLTALDSAKGTQAKNYFALCVYQLVVSAVKADYLPKSWITLPPESAGVICKAKTETIKNSIIAEQSPKPNKNISEPLCLKTVIASSEKLILKEAETIVGRVRESNPHT